jgi:hypothetical protein
VRRCPGGSAALNRYVQQTSNKNFTDLTPQQQDELLQAMEAGKRLIALLGGALLKGALHIKALKSTVGAVQLTIDKDGGLRRLYRSSTARLLRYF